MKYARPGQLLSDHLLGVADKTALRLPPQWKKIGYYAGLWHGRSQRLGEVCNKKRARDNSPCTRNKKM
jgi:hypothetical protein